MKVQTAKTVNGVSLGILLNTANLIKKKPSTAKTKFYISNKWVRGGHNITTITSFYNAGKEIFHKKPFTIQSDEPEILAGNDIAPSPVEHLLNALGACLTSSMVYHASVKGINIYEMESQIEGDIDLRGYLGLSNLVRKGYNKIRVRYKIKSDAKDLELLKYLSLYSPVFDVINHGTPVEISISDF
ncbi:MAG: osmotically inducible protein C [Planctomycetes bacterium GWF2_41_51]|nr:MAG: osmotically inducible protein C [Planctomycetes bacterium GWF2_41_51]HBG28313.1 osmotically inducible protein C [Phycisphaerales bacterium]